MRLTARVLDVQMRERLPATTETKNLDVVLAATVGSALDYGVEARNMASHKMDTQDIGQWSSGEVKGNAASCA
jgi:hypothetical protein